MKEINLNGLRVHRVNNTIFIPLPADVWRKSSGECCCEICRADNTDGWWDTLAVSATQENYEHTWMVHYPKLHNAAIRKQMAYRNK